MLLEAGGGSGKSVLANGLGGWLGVATVTARLTRAESPAAVMVGLIRQALRAARLSDLAAALVDRGASPELMLEALSEVLARSEDAVCLVIDDAHNLSDGGARAVLELAVALPLPHRLVVAARRLPEPLTQLGRQPGATMLDARDLAFTRDEAAALFARTGLRLADDVAEALRDAADGWAAALVMAASAIARSHDPERAIARLLVGGNAAPAALLEELLAGLSAPERAGLTQLAHLPLLSPAVVNAVMGSANGFQRILLAGVPLTPIPGSWWELRGPVAEQLRSASRLRGRTAAAAAPIYAALGEEPAAWETLLSAGLTEEAAALVAGIPPQRAEELGADVLAEAVDTLPASALDAHPGVLLLLARAAEAGYRRDLRTMALERLSQMPGLPPQQGVELDAELARDRLWAAETREAAEALAQEVLRRAGPDAVVARSRALDALGRARCWLSGRGTRESAEPLLVESARLSRSVGARIWAAQALVPLAMGVHAAACRYERALETLDQALAELPSRARYRTVVQSFRADVLTELGRPLEAEACIEDMRTVGTAHGEQWPLAFASWCAARSASYAGDRLGTVVAIVDAERHRDDWYEQVGGLEFLAHAGDLLDRVGENDLSREYLARAWARASEIDRPARLFSASAAGRSGDPEAAERRIAEMLARDDLEDQERWWLELLRAHAADRAGDPRAGRMAAIAFDRSLELGHPAGPMIREAAVSERLLPLAAAAGSRCAAHLLGEAVQMTVTLLGRFELRRGGRVIALPSGGPAVAVQAVAARGGRVKTEELLEMLWPGSAASASRNRLRNLLSRLRVAAGPVLVRDGDDVVLAADPAIDAVRFATEATRALTLHATGEHARAVVLARTALERYAGELLPGARYEAWTTEPREHLRALHLELLDISAEDAEHHGETDEAIRLLHRAIAAEPLDEARYVRLATLLASQGRVGSARAALARARAALRDAHLHASPDLLAAEAALRDP